MKALYMVGICAGLLVVGTVCGKKLIEKQQEEESE
jgi:hypothetical protein